MRGVERRGEVRGRPGGARTHETPAGRTRPGFRVSFWKPEALGASGLHSGGLRFGFSLLVQLHLTEVEEAGDRDHHEEGGAEREPEVAAREAGDQVPGRRAGRHDERVRELRRHVFDVVAAGARGREDRRVGNGRAVVAEDRTRKRRREDDDREVGVDALNDRHHDRNEDPERTPGRTRREGEEGGDEEDDHREEDREVAAARLHEALDEERGLEKVAADAGERPRKNQNDVRGEHQLGAFDEALHEVRKRHQTARDVEEERDGDGAEGGPDERRGGGGIADRSRERVERGIRTPVAARVHEGEDREDDQGEDGDQHVEDAAARVGVGRLGVAGGPFTDVARERAGFGAAHRPEVVVREDHEEDHHDREERVEVPGNGRDEGGHVGFKDAVPLQGRAHGGRPRAHRRDDADRRGGRVDDVGELRTGDAVAVAERAHHGADREAVEVVVDEDEDAQTARREQRRAAALDLRDGPLAVGLRAARHGDHVDQSAQHRAEDEDVEVDLVPHGREGALERPHEDVSVGTDRVDQGARENADQQRREHFLCEKRKDDGDDRGNDREPPGGKGFHLGVLLLSCPELPSGKRESRRRSAPRGRGSCRKRCVR